LALAHRTLDPERERALTERRDLDQERADLGPAELQEPERVPHVPPQLRRQPPVVPRDETREPNAELRRAAEPDEGAQIEFHLVDERDRRRRLGLPRSRELARSIGALAGSVDGLAVEVKS